MTGRLRRLLERLAMHPIPGTICAVTGPPTLREAIEAKAARAMAAKKGARLPSRLRDPSTETVDGTHPKSGSLPEGGSAATSRGARRRQSHKLDFSETGSITKDTFIDLLPARPYATDDFQKGMRFWPKQKAIEFKQIQFNHPNLIRCLLLDIDRSDASTAWQDANVTMPNIITINPNNGHCHYVYVLRTPVHKFERSSSKAFDYLKAIERGLTRRLGADVRYTGTTAKNPLHTAWKALWNRSEPYSLSDLDRWLEPEDKRPVVSSSFDFGTGRNCAIFDAVRRRAYREVRSFKVQGGSIGMWVERLLSYCYEINKDFQHGLYPAELKSIAKSIGNWTWWKYGHGLEKRQRARAKKRWAGHIKKEPWKVHNVSKRTWMRWKKAGRLETLHPQQRSESSE